MQDAGAGSSIWGEVVKHTFCFQINYSCRQYLRIKCRLLNALRKKVTRLFAMAKMSRIDTTLNFHGEPPVARSDIRNCFLETRSSGFLFHRLFFQVEPQLFHKFDLSNS